MSEQVQTGRIVPNPILRGFDPDPSILRVDDEYFIATSTFEWYPGVRIHRSTNLADWELVGGVLSTSRLVDLSGVPESGGVWAPQLSFRAGKFYLVFTNARGLSGGYWDVPNYVTTATSITGPWSDPVFLHSRGFDPSLFHDDDGRSWVVNMRADLRPGIAVADRFAGIELQEVDPSSFVLIGDPVLIFPGTEAGITEGPHLYRRDDWYYLVTAEGGTGWEHQVTVARSRRIQGPYTVDPAGPLLTSKNRPDLYLQKAGHGSFVVTRDDRIYLAHLASRPLAPTGECILGRETSLQEVRWEEGEWPRLPESTPQPSFTVPNLPARELATSLAFRDEFDGPLHPEWSSYRRPIDRSWVDTAARASFVRIRGGASPASRSGASLLARRVTSLAASFEASMEYEVGTTQQAAGVCAFYNSRNWYYACVTADDAGEPVFHVTVSDNGMRSTAFSAPLAGGPTVQVTIRAQVVGAALEFSYRSDPLGSWTKVTPTFDARTLSDEHATRVNWDADDVWAFTGAFFGLWVQDFTGSGKSADFDWVEYNDDFSPDAGRALAEVD